MKEILSKLEDTESIDIDQIIRDFLQYYRKNDRHKYHEITIYIISKFAKPEDGETIAIILYNLEVVMNAVVEKCGCKAKLDMNKCLKEQPPAFKCPSTIKASHCAEYKRLYRRLSKLHDHISLEYTRIGDIRQQGDRLEALLKQNTAKEISLRNAVENASIEVGNMKEKADYLQSKMDGSQREYITILGIFASIVLAFTGGIAFSTSVLENIDAISPYRLAATVIGLAFVMINIIYILVWFIQQINRSKDEAIDYPCFMKAINAILVIAVIITIICWYCWEKKADSDLSSQYQYSISVVTENKLETKPE